ncbi:MAG: histidinol dehydrogenase [Candidatus Eisenbacteria bacterium]|uniref:Histidinol dehydrogenase n=1 Tax=Eiseniibacteriota bacterium TaxID=2212470 RepID=A0A933SEZ7_UNCEI|nr:histidinol dehydrogenase [Candidatus Eisenbacteria bacterium]
MSADFLRYDCAPLAREERAVLTGRDGTSAASPEVAAEVTALLARVRGEGDGALREFAARFDGVTLDALEVPRAAWRAALEACDPALRAALERAARNIEKAHRAFLPAPVQAEIEPGVTVGRRPEPLACVGVYAPGGRAVYPSSVLMACVPARVAGVREIVLCSPPERATGLPSPLVLAAAELAGASRVFALGGAGAIGAMAFGTASVPRVDRIVGPGNAWVAEAKRQVSGVVGIDSPAGPSELLVLADAVADPRAVARELVAQAEHDPDASSLAVVVGAAAARAVAAALREEAASCERGEIVARSLGARGGVLVADTLAQATDFATRFAPEHLLLVVEDPAAALEAVRDAGAVFLGASSSVAFGDYLSGGNHVLPTAGFARTTSGLSTQDFVRWTQWQRVTSAAAASLAADCALLARAEGLPGHAAAALGAGTKGNR